MAHPARQQRSDPDERGSGLILAATALFTLATCVMIGWILVDNAGAAW